MREKPVIAIDGPPGAGKTTISKSLARELAFTFIDTGAMYRAAALITVKGGVGLDDTRSLGEHLAGLSVDFVLKNGEQRIVVNGEDVEEQIRSEEMGMRASDISKVMKVREILVEKQRMMGAKGGIVCEGRDATTVIFPNAEFKYFLDATVHKRAERRYRELIATGETPVFSDIYEEMITRDIQDSIRDNSPLRFASGVTYVDTTALSCDEVTKNLVKEIRKSGR